MNRLFFAIDGDEVLYKAAFASQHTDHYIRFSNGDVQGPFKTKKDCIEWLGDGEAEEVFSEVVPLPEKLARFQVKRIIREMLAEVRPDEHKLYLTGEGNFRIEVATLKPYKGNRSERDKPVHYDLIKGILRETYKAVTVDGIEADDAMSIASWQAQLRSTKWDVCIGTQDKDLKMVPGLHYNPSRKEKYTMSWQESRLCFYKQLLSGDEATDNIPGIFRMGEKTADKILRPLIDSSSDDLYRAVLVEYKKAEQNPKIRSKMPDGKWGEERITEVARLLWMLQETGQLWTPEEDYYSGC